MEEEFEAACADPADDFDAPVEGGFLGAEGFVWTVLYLSFYSLFPLSFSEECIPGERAYPQLQTPPRPYHVVVAVSPISQTHPACWYRSSPALAGGHRISTGIARGLVSMSPWAVLGRGSIAVCLKWQLVRYVVQCPVPEIDFG